MHVRLADLDVVEAHDRIDLDRMRFGALADHLPVDLALGRHINNKIAANPGLAAEPSAWRKLPALRGIASLGLSPWAHMVGARTNCVLGEIALGDFDLTAAANAPPTADRIEIDAERPCGRKQVHAFSELAPLARGREDDAMGAQR